MVTQQMTLFDETESYHNTGQHGFFSLLAQWPDGKRQSSHLLTEMVRVLGLVDISRDNWITQAEFTRPNRRVVNLLRVGLLFADIDTYKMPWAQGRTPEQLADAVAVFCRQEGIPEPSFMVFSGRGIQAKWLLTGALPRRALPRWNACQRQLVSRLAPVGADPMVKDASRVLRLVSTVNLKSGQICRVVSVNESGGEPVRYNFEYLAEQLLPVARWDIEKQRQTKARRQLRLLLGGKNDNLRRFSGRQLAWDRLEDLRRLAVLRGGVSEGERMKNLFWQLNFLLLSGATNPAQMYHEAAALATELDPSWSYKSKELMTLYAKARAYEAGETVEFGSRNYSPLYTPKNTTLIEIFQISDVEQASLKTIISRRVAINRHKTRETARRRAAGAVDRQQYLDVAQAKREQARALKAEGLSVRAIARRMGVSAGAVAGYLQGVQSPCVLLMAKPYVFKK